MEEKILNATLKVLAAEGYDGARTRAIAEEAGVSEVTLFRKFKNKENLIKEAKKLKLENALERMEKLFQSIEGNCFEASVSALGNRISDSLDKKTNMITMAIEELQRLPASERMIPKYINAMHDHLAKYFDSQIEVGNMRRVDPQIAALSFFSFLFYTNFFCKPNKAGKEIRTLEGFLDIFMNGVRSLEKKIE
jgi:AcrR family transcriptional regulator